jgi:hypothetical protein
MRNIVLLIVMAIFVIGISIGNIFADEVGQKYPGAWREEFNKDITLTLAKNKVAGCGSYAWKPAVDSHGEFLVKCDESYYMVWIYSQNIMGPYRR